MTRRNLLAVALFAAALSLPSAANAQPKVTDPIKVGMVNAFFTDLPDGLVQLVTEPFPALMKNVAGLNGTLSYRDDAYTTAAKLDKGELNLGVFHGHELAWVRTKYPKLKPLMIVVNNKHDVRAFVVVRQDNPATCLANLRGKTLDVPAQTKEHCRVFVGKHCADNKECDWRKFFGKVAKSSSPVEALDEVSRGKCDAAVVDTIGLDFYKAVKGPVFAKNLRVLQHSDAFPSAVIAYKEGSLPAETLKQFCDGLKGAGKNADAVQLFQLWNIDGFELPPANYNECLSGCLKTYPAPQGK
jgi:ABC-type phosphate/phosphonate transport system substrate-binding protein